MDIAPVADRLVILLSRRVLHQVLPTLGDFHRYALVAWMRVQMSEAVGRELFDYELLLKGDGDG